MAKNNVIPYYVPGALGHSLGTKALFYIEFLRDWDHTFKFFRSPVACLTGSLRDHLKSFKDLLSPVHYFLDTALNLISIEKEAISKF